jgi:hypothetical protein
MDWFSDWEPTGYVEIERVDPPADSGMLIAWLILAVLVVAGFVAWYRKRVVRRSFWCATAGRGVEVCFRRSGVLSCSAFEESAAIACARRCMDRGFRAQWPPALPVLMRPSSRGRAG